MPVEEGSNRNMNIYFATDTMCQEQGWTVMYQLYLTSDSKSYTLYLKSS